MEPIIVLIWLIGRCHKLQKYLTLLLLFLCSCHNEGNWGFFQPPGLNIYVPEGPPEFKAGWYAGCRSSLSQNSFYNASIFYKERGGPNFGSGMYQNHPIYQSSWSTGYANCQIYIATFQAGRYFNNRHPIR